MESSRSRNLEFDSVENKAYLGLVAFSVHPFPAFYSPAELPLPFTYSVEVFPLSYREIEMSWSIATCFFWSGILPISFPPLFARKGTVGAFRFYV
jgi:Sugar (and other) transporter